MNIQEALKETGKARGSNDEPDNYAALDIDGRLYWFDVKDNSRNSPIQLDAILGDHWQPYHPKEEMRPRN